MVIWRKEKAAGMIDNFSIAITHGLMLLAAWILVRRPDLDRESNGSDAKARKPRPGKHDTIA